MSAKASRSASHNSGNSSATCDTGQWCWQIWTPSIGPVTRVVVVAYPAPVSATATRSAAVATSPLALLSRDVGQDGVDASPREGADGVVATHLAQLTHGGYRQVVVGVVELGPPSGGDPKTLRGTTPPVVLPLCGGVRFGVAALDQRVQMPAHACRRNAQAIADFTGRRGAF